MKKLFTQQEFNKAKYYELLPLKCNYCHETFSRKKKNIDSYIKRNIKAYRFCSRKCFSDSRLIRIKLSCKNCNLEIYKTPYEIKQSVNYFCSRSCAAAYNNTHKTTGNRRSKLEIWIEQQLAELYPNLEVLYNKTEIINSELDIYIPSLKLAVEINGIYHYEPIHGQDKLGKIQNNDNRKLIACYEKDIELLLIDTSSMKNFKEHNAQKFLKMIENTINQKIQRPAFYQLNYSPAGKNPKTLCRSTSQQSPSISSTVTRLPLMSTTLPTKPCCQKSPSLGEGTSTRLPI